MTLSNTKVKRTKRVKRVSIVKHSKRVKRINKRHVGVISMATLEELVKKYANKHGVPPELLYSLVGQESGGVNGKTSNKGASGLAQIMPATFKTQAKKIGLNNADVWNPEHNLDVGASYLKDQLVKYGDVSLALAAYNAGPAAVDKFGGIPPYRETRNYVDKIRNSLNKSRNKLNSGSATNIENSSVSGSDGANVGSGVDGNNPYVPDQTGSNYIVPKVISPPANMPPASNYPEITNKQLNELQGYLDSVRGTIISGNKELRAIDNQRMAQMQELLNRVNYDPMNPNSIGSQNVAELARLSAVQRATEIDRERVGRAGLFDNPAAFIEKTLFGNPYAQGAKDNLAAIQRLSDATGRVDERIKSQADMAKAAYVADPSVVRADMASALQLADINKEVGIAQANMPLKLEELQLKRFQAETDAAYASTSAQRQQLALQQDQRSVQQQAETDAALKASGTSRAAIEASKLRNEGLLADRGITTSETAISSGNDINAELDKAAKLRVAKYANAVNEARASGEVDRLPITLETDNLTAFSQYLKAGNVLASDKVAAANVEINSETQRATYALQNIQANGALSRGKATEALSNLKLLTDTILGSESLKDAKVYEKLGDVRRLTNSLEAQIKMSDVKEAQATQASRYEQARAETLAATKRAQVDTKNSEYTLNNISEIFSDKDAAAALARKQVSVASDKLDTDALVNKVSHAKTQQELDNLSSVLAVHANNLHNEVTKTSQDAERLKIESDKIEIEKQSTSYDLQHLSETLAQKGESDKYKAEAIKLERSKIDLGNKQAVIDSKRLDASVSNLDKTLELDRLKISYDLQKIQYDKDRLVASKNKDLLDDKTAARDLQNFDKASELLDMQYNDTKSKLQNNEAMRDKVAKLESDKVELDALKVAMEKGSIKDVNAFNDAKRKYETNVLALESEQLQNKFATSSVVDSATRIDAEYKIKTYAEKDIMNKQAVLGATKLGSDKNEAAISQLPPETIKALSTADKNGYAGANSYQSYSVMQSLGIGSSSNATSPKIGETWRRLQSAMVSNIPEGITTSKDREAWFASSPQDVYVAAANKMTGVKKMDSSSSLRSPEDVYSLPDHADIVAAGLSEPTAKIFSELDDSVLKTGSAEQLIAAINDTPTIQSSVFKSPAAGRLAVSNAISEYMSKAIKVANDQNGYEKLGLPKMTNKNLTMSVTGTTDITGLGWINITGGSMNIDLTDPAQVARLVISKDMFTNAQVYGR